ncbi:urease-associated protein [Flavobacterium faecale]|uniref:Urease-associated protein n=1 Tax=Flavobacterium faecale TaxID=1355330 RepID=A0A2S1L946_9FLAO|nr:TIGR02117 family protein [Flavobacterium faecale]AWG20270.1 urease-associated protein [Flavobacterium faecale]
MNWKPILKYTAITLLSVVGFVLLYSLTAYCLSRITVDGEPQSSSDVTIYIQTNGVHTDIVVPIKSEQRDWSKNVLFKNTIAKDSTAQFLGMGWGDKGFYLETPTWADLKASVAFKAATGLSTTAIHVTYFKTITENESCKKINISKKQYRRLIAYIDTSFQKDLNGNFINIKTNANYSKHDAFYEATGNYSLLHTCNTWANNALKSCGQKACLWTPFDTGIFLKY